MRSTVPATGNPACGTNIAMHQAAQVGASTATSIAIDTSPEPEVRGGLMRDLHMAPAPFAIRAVHREIAAIPELAGAPTASPTCLPGETVVMTQSLHPAGTCASTVARGREQEDGRRAMHAHHCLQAPDAVAVARREWGKDIQETIARDACARCTALTRRPEGHTAAGLPPGTTEIRH
jgi:hypothetical protein